MNKRKQSQETGYRWLDSIGFTVSKDLLFLYIL